MAWEAAWMTAVSSLACTGTASLRVRVPRLCQLRAAAPAAGEGASKLGNHPRALGTLLSRLLEPQCVCGGKMGVPDPYPEELTTSPHTCQTLDSGSPTPAHLAWCAQGGDPLGKHGQLTGCIDGYQDPQVPAPHFPEQLDPGPPSPSSRRPWGLLPHTPRSQPRRDATWR